MIRLGELLEKRLSDDRTSHDMGSEPRSQIPFGCLGHEDPIHLQYHRGCVAADRFTRACAIGICSFRDSQAEKPHDIGGCQGWHGKSRIVNDECYVGWDMCARQKAWRRAKRAQTPKGTKQRAWEE